MDKPTKAELARERRAEGYYTEAEKAYKRKEKRRRLKVKRNSARLRELARLDLVANGTPLMCSKKRFERC